MEIFHLFFCLLFAFVTFFRLPLYSVRLYCYENKIDECRWLEYPTSRLYSSMSVFPHFLWHTFGGDKRNCLIYFYQLLMYNNLYSRSDPRTMQTRTFFLLGKGGPIFFFFLFIYLFFYNLPYTGHPMCNEGETGH